MVSNKKHRIKIAHEYIALQEYNGYVRKFHMDNRMSEIEGVIKYNFDYIESASFDFVDLKELSAWRKVLFLLKLIGQDPERYDGFSYGNVNRRLNSKEKSRYAGEYLISGTQTGHLPDLDLHH